jgi:late competence protein required for DNA uptake (superfamily II DNA/RNA helicase)
MSLLLFARHRRTRVAFDLLIADEVDPWPMPLNQRVA